MAYMTIVGPDFQQVNKWMAALFKRVMPKIVKQIRTLEENFRVKSPGGGPTHVWDQRVCDADKLVGVA